MLHMIPNLIFIVIIILSFIRKAGLPFISQVRMGKCKWQRSLSRMVPKWMLGAK